MGFESEAIGSPSLTTRHQHLPLFCRNGRGLKTLEVSGSDVQGAQILNWSGAEGEVPTRRLMGRLLRIAGGIELFALVLWVGGLFFLLAIARPALLAAHPDNPDLVWDIMNILYGHFGSVQIPLAIAVLCSNFYKTAISPPKWDLQRFTLLVSAIMLSIALMTQFSMRPHLETRWMEAQKASVKTFAVDREPFAATREHYESILAGSMFLGLFMVYSYRRFEERHFAAFLRLFRTEVTRKDPPPGSRE